MRLRERIESFDPKCLVVDPLLAILKSGEQYSAEDVAQRLLYGTKAKGITTVSTSLMGTDLAISPTTALGVSTIADTWIHLSYELQGGEQNRALYIVKSRGTGHSNQVRELVLSDEGLALADVYTAGGEVLMGTMRWEREEALRREEAQARREAEVRRRELEVAEAEVQARIKLLQRELEARRAARNLERINRDQFNGQCEIELVDIFAAPQRALEDSILVTPTLIKLSPAPRVRIIGDLSAEERVIFSLGGR